MNETTMNAEEVAEFLKTTRAGVYAMVQRRQIPFHRVGKRRILFFKEELIVFLENRVVNPSREVSPDGRKGHQY